MTQTANSHTYTSKRRTSSHVSLASDHQCLHVHILQRASSGVAVHSTVVLTGTGTGHTSTAWSTTISKLPSKPQQPHSLKLNRQQHCSKRQGAALPLGARLRQNASSRSAAVLIGPSSSCQPHSSANHTMTG